MTHGSLEMECSPLDQDLLSNSRGEIMYESLEQFLYSTKEEYRVVSVQITMYWQEVEIEKQSDIVVEEILQLEIIISGREHDLTLMIYKPPPTTLGEYEISDTTILPVFSTPKKNVSTGYHITGDSAIEMEIFEEWINDGLYKKHTKKKDNDDHYKVNCSTLEFHQFYFVVAFSKSKNWFYLMYQQNKCWNDEHKIPTDWTALTSYEGKSKRNPFQVEYVSEIAQKDSGSLDCGVFVVVYFEYLSEGLGIPCSGIDAQYHRLRYTFLL
ncbi:putative protein EIN4-like [Capsicum annuum]|nr:putative protein EIN4-like [Capsicum annuum]